MENDRDKAVSYLENLQLTYCQFPHSIRKEDILKRFNDKEHPFLLEQFNSIKHKYPSLSFESFKEQMLQSRSARHEHVCDTKYQNPIWYSTLVNLLSTIEPVIEERYSSYSKDFLFGSLPLGQVNAVASAVPDCKYKLILINEGIFGFANLFSKAIGELFEKTNINDQEGVIIDKEKVLKNLRNAPHVWDRVFMLCMGYVIEGNPLAWTKQYFMKPEASEMYSVLRDAMEVFIVGHEYGHIIRGHLGERYTIESKNIKHQIAFSQIQEKEADNVGLNISLDAMINNQIGAAAGFAGADLFFLGIDLIEKSHSLLKYGKVQSTPNFYGTHPPIAYRRMFIRALINESFEKVAALDIFDFADTLEKVVSELWLKIAPAIYKLHLKGARPHKMW